MSTSNELDLVVKYAGQKGGGEGQLVIDDVEISQSRDNRVRHGIGNEDPQNIEKGNRTYTFSTTTMMSSSAASALKSIDDGSAETQGIFIKEGGVWEETASGMIFNDLTTSASDDGDVTVSIDADLLNVTYTELGNNGGGGGGGGG